jgi:O-succinylbenzoic acid--CoA ligase
MRIIFESGEFNLGDADSLLPPGSQALETIALINSWNQGANTFTINTSGTTGEYKSIVLTREQMIWSAEQTAKACGLRTDEKEYCSLPIDKVGGMMQIIRSVIFDRELKVVTPIADPMSKLDDDHDYSLTSLTPYQFYHISQDENSLDKLARFKAILIGGGPIAVELEEKIRSFEKWVDSSFYHTYGMTETASHIALRKIKYEGGSERFKAFAGVIITQDKDHCMHIAIPQLGVQLPTHDIIDQNSKGFSFVGRIDNIINSGGLKIIPEPIERELALAIMKKGLRIPLYLKGIDDEALGQKCVLVIEAKSKNHIPLLHEILESHVEAYQRPKDIHVISQFKYTKTNKLIRA